MSRKLVGIEAPPNGQIRPNFKRPDIGPRAYVAVGPSGWAETFARREADAALDRLLGSLTRSQVFDGYRRKRHNEDGVYHYDWNSIIGFLADLLACSETALAPEAIIAFWANLILDDEHKLNANAN